MFTQKHLHVDTEVATVLKLHACRREVKKAQLLMVLLHHMT